MPAAKDARSRNLDRWLCEDIEADELPADLLTDLHAAIAATQNEAPKTRREQAVQFLAEVTDRSATDVEQALGAFERGGPRKRERVFHAILDEWLEAQRRADRHERLDPPSAVR